MAPSVDIARSVPWYVARSAGLVAWGLLTGSTLWGLALSTKVFGKRPRPNWLLDLHRYLGGLATVFVVVHVAGVLTDKFVPFSWLDVVIPFRAHWRPVAIAWGVVGLYLLAAVELTSLIRNRLSKRVWHAVHLASFPLFLSATVHALTAGTDAHTWAFLGFTIGGATLVVFLTAARIATDVKAKPAERPARIRTAAPAPATRTAAPPTGAPPTAADERKARPLRAAGRDTGRR